jgi:aldose 1-epimerase
MFYIDTITDIDFTKLVLKDATNGTTATVIPFCGAILHAFTVLHNGQLINVIDGYQDKDDFARNVTAKGFKSCKLSPFACRINNASYFFNHKEYRIEKFLLNGSALHGLIYDAPFTVTKMWADENSAGAVLGYSYNGTDKGYPFAYDCEVKYELKKDNVLTLTTTVFNKHNEAIPIQDGWHPYFTFGGTVNNLQLSFKSKEMVEFNDDLIPTGKLIVYNDFKNATLIGDTAFDNCFTLQSDIVSAACTLKDEAQKIQLEIYPDKSYPYLQLYTPPHRNSIAIENLSAVPDTFNNQTGLIVLAPESAAHFTTIYKITSLL